MLLNSERFVQVCARRGLDGLVATSKENVYYASEYLGFGQWILPGSQAYVVLAANSAPRPRVVCGVGDADMALEAPLDADRYETFGTFFFEEGPGVLQPDHGHAHDRAAAPSPPDDPPTSGAHRPVLVTRDATALSDDALLHALELGDVVLAYDAPRPPAALRSVQRAVAGPFDSELAAAGQAVILDRRRGVHGVIALAWRRELRTSGPGDARLRDFAEAWLGRGATAG